VFPISHLYIAGRVLSAHPVSDEYAAAFLLGSIAPDAAQFRDGYQVSDKLITHICPDNGEAWGHVTANDWWKDNVRKFISEHGGEPFAMGYATHIYGDIFNNIEIWGPFVRANPTAEAGVYRRGGSVNVYYTDCGQADTRLYRELMEGTRWLDLLAKAEPAGMQGLVSARDVGAIRDNVLTEYPTRHIDDKYIPVFLTYEKLMHVAESAADYITTAVFPSPFGANCYEQDTNHRTA
jgi:hypothetical protein